MASIRGSCTVIDMASIRGSCTVIALLVIVITFSGKAQSQDATTPPSQPRPRYVLFHQYEVEALDIIRRNWTSQNSQFESLLKWVDQPGRHPCNISNMNYDSSEFEGDWVGVFCTMLLRESNSTGYYYEASVTQFMLYGSNSRCGWEYSKPCGFDGIKGVLLPEIARLTSLQRLYLDNHPDLTGPVPIEIWQMPNLLNVALQNNNLEGTLASDVLTPASKLQGIYVYKNRFSGRLQVSTDGTLFSSTLKFLNVTSNRLSGPVDLRGLNANASGNLVHLALDDNEFNGTFSIGSALKLQNLFLSKNQFTRIQFPNYTGNGSEYMSALQTLYLDNNNLSGPFPQEFLQMPELRNLYLGNNNFSGLVDFKATTNNSWILHIKSLDLSMNNFFGPVDFQSNYNISGLIYLNISNNGFDGPLVTNPSLNIWEIDVSNNHFNDIIFNGSLDQVENGYMSLLKTLYIQNNKLGGEFPYQIFRAPSLQVLYASNNQYTSLQLPNIPLQNSSLKEISFVNNKIVSINYPSDPGQLSPSNLEISNLLFLGGNPLCNIIENILLSTICRMNETSPLLKVVSRYDKKYRVIVATSTSTAFGFLLLVATLYVWRLMKRIKSLHFILGEFEKKEVKPNLYSYKEIKLATKNFDKKNKLGEGGFGAVYKGELFDGTLVAVKKLTKASSQMLSEFLNEVVVISACKHRNLVKLKGCCLGDGDQRMLVFEFVENKNLEEALWKQGGSRNSNEDLHLDWATRFNIIVGIARGLAYLHDDLQSPIIHRDIKASNILLDKNYSPKIADFGLACLFPTFDYDVSHLTTIELAGTRGYYSPEYALHGYISTALDVYSFGIVVLEIISGRKRIDSQRSSQEVDLREWAWSQFEAQTTTSLIDPDMKHSSHELEAIVHVICIALSCVHYKTTMRPKMHDVVSMLTKNMPVGDFGGGFMYGEESEYYMAEVSTTTSSSWKKSDESSSLDENQNTYLMRITS